MSDPLSPLAVVPSLEFSTISDNLEGSLAVHSSSLPLDILGELEEADGFETDASSNDQCSILLSQKRHLLRSIYLTSLILWS